jgi:hypothetical protein
MGADITHSSHFLVLVQQSMPDVNEWLTIRNLGRDFFKWLPIGRCDVRHGSRGWMRTGGVRVIKGDIAAVQAFMSGVAFSPQGAWIKTRC